MRLRRYFAYLLPALFFSVGLLVLATLAALQPAASSYRAAVQAANQPRFLDRNGVPLTAAYHERWNTTEGLRLHQFPAPLPQSFLISEDKRFFEHGGVDFKARLGALRQAVRSGQRPRGASTITEQVVRILHPRERSLWSKWLEGFEAAMLERHFTKEQILEFYLNQLPYAAGRRGVGPAARYYFDRELDTLSVRELLALVVLVRAPSSFDLYRHPGRVAGPIERLAEALYAEGVIDQSGLENACSQSLALRRPRWPVNVEHLVAYLRSRPDLGSGREIRTTIDSGRQRQVQQILDARIRALHERNLFNGAALVADHQSGEILAWVVAGEGRESTPAAKVNAVTVPRQPGSALKPFLYAAALDRGWSAATIIVDEPLAGAVGHGRHFFRNYSNTFYGPVSVREALGSSLNIPAVKTIRYVGVDDYLKTLRSAGFSSLSRAARIYDDGLALGSGEVSLLELVQGYAMLAQGGGYSPLRLLAADPQPRQKSRIFSREAATLVADILSDPQARRLEFGADSVLNLPVQTAIKTGTATDYRDAWALGFNDRYVVGVWLGNLNYQATNGVSGASGPGLVLRSVFAELNRQRATSRLKLSPKLLRREFCRPGHEGLACVNHSELFMPGVSDLGEDETVSKATFAITQPSAGLKLALDPRVPRESQYFPLRVAGLAAGQRVEWFVNDQSLGPPSPQAEHLWQLEKGHYRLMAKLYGDDSASFVTPVLVFVVN